MEIRKEEQILEVAESVTLQNLSCLSEEFEDQGGALTSLIQLNKNIEKNRSRMTGTAPKAETQKQLKVQFLEESPGSIKDIANFTSEVKGVRPISPLYQQVLDIALQENADEFKRELD